MADVSGDALPMRRCEDSAHPPSVHFHALPDRADGSKDGTFDYDAEHHVPARFSQTGLPDRVMPWDVRDERRRAVLAMVTAEMNRTDENSDVVAPPVEAYLDDIVRHLNTVRMSTT